MKKNYVVMGMMCEHCEMHLKKDLEKIVGVISANCNHKKNEVIIESEKEIDINLLKETIKEAGYELKN